MKNYLQYFEEHFFRQEMSTRNFFHCKIISNIVYSDICSLHNFILLPFLFPLPFILPLLSVFLLLLLPQPLVSDQVAASQSEHSQTRGDHISPVLPLLLLLLLLLFLLSLPPPPHTHLSTPSSTAEQGGGRGGGGGR